MSALPVIFAVLVLASDAWVYTDARARAAAGDPARVAIGTLRVETPEAWFLACLHRL